jgi:hypothetical protein
MDIVQTCRSGIVQAWEEYQSGGDAVIAEDNVT